MTCHHDSNHHCSAALCPLIQRLLCSKANFRSVSLDSSVGRLDAAMDIDTIACRTPEQTGGAGARHVES